jgi:hypothetical protein
MPKVADKSKNDMKFLKAQVNNLRAQVKRLRLISIGCSKHPTYRAKRRFSSPCEVCEQVWQYRQELNQLETDDLRFTATASMKAKKNHRNRK